MILAGHAPAWRAWRAALASGRVHHAWLLAGPRGIGKASFARAAAAGLVGEPGVPQPSPAAHPDIIVLAPLPDGEEEARKRDEGRPFRARRNVTVDQVRRMQARLTTRPTLGPRRAIIVDPADDLEGGAANALLKSLEEPPAGTLFLLIAHNPGRLLATVRSRCRVLRFAPLGDAQVQAVLARDAPDADTGTRLAAVAAARGAPGMALDFAARDLGEAFSTMRRLIAEGDADLTGRTALVAAFGQRPERERLLAGLALARALLAGELAGAPRARQAAIIAAHAEVSRIAAQAPTYNFDPELLLLEIGGLLASTAVATSAPVAG